MRVLPALLFAPLFAATGCGGCGVPCTTGQTCEAGACVCPSGAVDCNGACVAPDTVGCGGATGSLVVTSAPGAYWNTDGSIIEVTAGIMCPAVRYIWPPLASRS